MLTKADRDRIDGREFAEEVLRDVEGTNFSSAFLSGFWREVRCRAKMRRADVPANAGMSNERSKVFGRRTIEFGKYSGKRYDDVPLEYLEWLADQGAELLSYLRSRRIKDEGAS